MTDHVQKAKDWLAGAVDTGDSPAQIAQAHATLALVEQQKRIADWLENWPLGFRGEPMTGGWND